MDVQRILWVEAFPEEKRVAERQWPGTISVTYDSRPFHRLCTDDFNEPYLLTTRTHSRFRNQSHDFLRAVLSRSTGYDHLKNKRFDCPVGYLPGYATEAVADYNLTVTRSLLRRIPESRSAMRRFRRKGLTGKQLQSCSIGILGVGRIGKSTAETLSLLGCELYGTDPNQDRQWAQEVGMVYCTLDELFLERDAVISCLPKTSNSEGLIQLEHLRTMNDECVFVNSGRGETVESRVILKALEEGSLMGAALDVFNREPEVSELLSNPENQTDLDPEMNATLKLIDHENVIATPHNAFNTHAAVEQKVNDTITSIEMVLKEGAFPNPVPN